MKNDEEIENKLRTQLKKQQFLLDQKTNIINKYVFTTTSDLHGNILDISQAYLDFTGYTREQVIGKNHKIFRNSSLSKSIIKNLWDTITQDKVWIGELKNNKTTGEEYWVRAIIQPLYDIDNKKIGYLSIKENITTRKRLLELSNKDELTQLYNKKHFENFVKKEINRSKSHKERIALLVIEIDDFYKFKSIYGDLKSNKILFDLSTSLKEQLKENMHMQEIFKTSESEFTVIILNQDDTYIQNIAQKLLLLAKEQDIKTLDKNVENLLTFSIGTINLYPQKYDITCNDFYNIADANLSQAKQAGGDTIVSGFDEEYLQNLKNIDHITKLPNRSALVQDLAALESEAMLIILHINQINSLKELYGFEFIRETIVKKASELKQVLYAQESSLYNLNLQEFAILITDKTLFDKYILILKHSILMPHEANEEKTTNYLLADFTAGVSYGLQNIFNHADLILQEAIISKDSYKVYLNNQSAKQLQEDNLNKLKIYKHALHTGNIIPYFQPIVDTNSTDTVKYEALARIETEEGEIISPYYFLDAAKEDKTFEYFTRQMMQKVFNVFAKNDIKISINLTFENINSESMVDYIKNRLDKYGGDGITFEVLESEDILDYKIIEDFIKLVKSYGCKVSIDDFGSGYSNFTNIIKLDIDYIKLDGSLIQKLNTDENVKHMINGLLVYAKNANIKTIAEFVSSKELSDTVKELGIDYIQGYYYGEPKAPEYYGLI